MKVSVKSNETLKTRGLTDWIQSTSIFIRFCSKLGTIDVRRGKATRTHCSTNSPQRRCPEAEQGIDVFVQPQSEVCDQRGSVGYLLTHSRL